MAAMERALSGALVLGLGLLLCSVCVPCSASFDMDLSQIDYPASAVDQSSSGTSSRRLLPRSRDLLSQAVRTAASVRSSSSGGSPGDVKRRRLWLFSSLASSTSAGVPDYEPCEPKWTDYTPCEDPVRAKKFPKTGMVNRERHCPSPEEQLKCLIPPPVGYKRPISWPQSRDEAWYVNVPHKHLTTAKADQNWIRYEDSTEKFIFPGGGTMFHEGADKYLEELGKLIPLTTGEIRTALDTGCGVGSFGGYLLSRNVLTMSLAPRDGHEAQVQFALERGLPAMISVLASKRLPFPARAFDLAHCSRCLIPWYIDDGRLLAEVDRVLRPGGFWVLTGPPIDWKQYARGWQRTEEDLKAEQDRIEATAASLCWEKFTEVGMFGIWRKPLTGECALNKATDDKPPVCPLEQNPDLAWYAPMSTCVSRVPSADYDDSGIAGGKLQQWPERLHTVPPRIAKGTISGIDEATLKADDAEWVARLEQYKAGLLPALSQGRFRNIMDMNAGLGGFAAALADDPVWVMNVVPVTTADAGKDSGEYGGEAAGRLGAIFERGLLGTYQDWCEAFSTYPRTYDMLHAASLFTNWASRECGMEQVLLEMDRILRPEGAALIQDEPEVLEKIEPIVKAMRWDARIEELKVPEGSEGTVAKKVLVCFKKYWTEA